MLTCVVWGQPCHVDLCGVRATSSMLWLTGPIMDCRMLYGVGDTSFCFFVSRRKWCKQLALASALYCSLIFCSLWLRRCIAQFLYDTWNFKIWLLVGASILSDGSKNDWVTVARDEITKMTDEIKKGLSHDSKNGWVTVAHNEILKIANKISKMANEI
jgi:hypothetical protein